MSHSSFSPLRFTTLRISSLCLRALIFFFTLVVVFVLTKPLFVLVQPAELRSGVGVKDLCEVMLYGLPLDLATAAYLSLPVWLVALVGVWVKMPAWSWVGKVYAAVLSVVLSLIYIGDACLYGFWHFRLDATVWTYLSQPAGALQSVTKGYAMCVSLAFVVAVFVLYAVLSRALLFETNKKNSITTHSAPRYADTLKVRAAFTFLWIVAGGLLFLCIRGGVGKSTANVGMVYYSDRSFFNHSAVNPAFSLISSTTKQKDFSKEGQFFSNDERRRILSSLHYSTESIHSEMLLNQMRPNVLVILMEGCGAEFVHAVNAEADPQITPHLNRLAEEGIVFTRAYANSFRTDRGTVCTLSGFPSYPDVSVMKLPTRCATLPSIARSLRGAGYSAQFLYGGDINFTNTNGYLMATGYERTYGDTHFPSSVRRTHDWGVTDAIAFDTLSAMVMRQPSTRPWHIGFLTLASHEPWKVPYNRIPSDKHANAMAYLDDCIGRFVLRLKQSPVWQNTLVVLLPDHGIPYRDLTSDTDERKSHIPIIWIGGVVKRHQVIDKICNQTDLAATLLGQMGIDHNDFPYSRDVLSQTYTHPSAVHSWSEGIYYMDDTGISVVNLLTKPVGTFREEPHPSTFRTNAAKALLQTFYGELSKK